MLVQLLIFYATLLVMLVAVMASALCLASYAVSRRKLFAFAAVSFLAYFFDVAVVFQDDFVAFIVGLGNDPSYLMLRSLISVVTGTGILAPLWLLACSLVDEQRPGVKALPCVLFVLGSLFALLCMGNSSMARFAFWGIRGLFVMFTLLYLAFAYLRSTDEGERRYLRHYGKLYAAFWVLTPLFVFEDFYFFVLQGAGSVAASALSFTPERNYAEELLMMVCAAVALVSSIKTLSLRYERPPARRDERVETMIDGHLEVFSQRYQLSKREEEVLHMILLGLDNQNIASSMHVALSTVKSHIHNILKKTGHANRQELIQDFWKV